ncbi:hypothetical protein K7432_014280 [Basidiobolus ranarum]|uniref:PAS domain-containing protein n=1 Tax=Basidiobolus ranarum TaxID=34480 RepID=A0ABR2WHU7_9FUNG
MAKFTFVSITNSSNTEIIYLSQSFEDVLGFSIGNWLGKAPIDLFHPEDREGIVIITETCVKLQKLATLVYTRILSASGYQILEICISHCYDILVCSNRLLREEDLPGIFGMFHTIFYY